jgi:histone-lysine N-methyltransferase SETD3
VPRKQIITLEMAEESPIGTKMMYHNLKSRLLSPKHGFLTTYILQERKKNEAADFFPFIDVLPKTFENFPIFFTPEEKEWLKGSPFLEQVEEKIEDVKADFDLICEKVPEYSQFDYTEFSEIRMMVSSRIFGMNIDGKKTDGFVPMADMLNHMRPKQTAWTYSDEQDGFIIEALKDIGRNEQIYDSYGKKCNSRFFLNYGFIVENNDGNEVPIKVYYPDSDDKKAMKKEMINDYSDFKKFRVTDNFNENIMHEFLSWLRFVEYDENITLLIDYQSRASNQPAYNDSDSDDAADDPNKGFKAKDLPPLSVRCETKVLLRMKLEATKLLSRYPQTYEEDLEILANNKDLTFNTRNATLMRSGEKEILHHIVDTSNKMLEFFSLDVNELRKVMKNNAELKDDQKNYIKRVMIPLIKDRD